MRDAEEMVPDIGGRGGVSNCHSCRCRCYRRCTGKTSQKQLLVTAANTPLICINANLPKIS